MRSYYSKNLFHIILLLLLFIVSILSTGAQQLMEGDDNLIEPLRNQFKELLQRNPNYFGTLKDNLGNYKSVYAMSTNTSYEELKCVGLYPEQDVLEAVIEMKLRYGFGGSLCQAGTKEYVAFYIDYGDGAGFTSTGAPAEVSVHNISFVNGGHLYYSVEKSFTPPKHFFCTTPQIVKVRAILSWEAPPTGPSFIPVWGNIKDVWVQIKPRQLITVFPVLPQHPYLSKDIPLPFAELNEYKKENGVFLEPEQSVFIGDPVEIKKYIENSLAVKEKLKEKGEIEKERFNYKEIIMKNPNYFGSLFSQKSKIDFTGEFNKSFIDAEQVSPMVVNNLELLQPVLTFLLKTKYEELTCVGLYPEQDLLEATVSVKKPYGYNGDLCTIGSKEYVVFYIDWGDGSGYQYVATTAVKVHDIPSNAKKPLHYAVKAVIPNINARLTSCSIENIVKVKAILSWEFNPTGFGPNFIPTWGNVLERYVQIRPKDSVQCSLNIVNEIHVDEISQAGLNKGLAIKSDNAGNFVTGVYDRPFGGIIGCWGNINIPGAVKYRFRYSSDNGTTWNNITDARRAKAPPYYLYPVITRTPDPDGWFSIQDYKDDILIYPLAALVHWKSGNRNGDYLLQLQLGDSGGVMSGQDDTVAIKLDNKAPDLLEFGGDATHPTPGLPTFGVAVKDTANQYKKCGTFLGNELIRIFGNFKDEHFLRYSLLVFGGNIHPSGVGISISAYGDGNGRYDSGIAGIGTYGVTGAFDGGLGTDIGNLNLCTVPQIGGKIKCAYGIRLWLTDRSIRGSVSGYTYNTYRNHNKAFITFTWDPAGCP